MVKFQLCSNLIHTRCEIHARLYLLVPYESYDMINANVPDLRGNPSVCGLNFKLH